MTIQETTERLHALGNAWEQFKHVNDSRLKELERNLGQKLRLPPALLERTLRDLRIDCELAPPGTLLSIAGVDAADRRVLSDAAACAADAFVTGDAALLALGRVDALPILTPRQLWDRLRNSPE